MFLDELEQRSGRLAAGAKAVAAGEAAEVDLASMRREGHTIKGTARVMGYDAVAVGAVVLEAAWDQIAAEDLEATPSVGEAMLKLCDQLREAGRESPTTGTPGLRSALADMGAAVPSIEVPDLPEAAPSAEPEPATAVVPDEPKVAPSAPPSESIDPRPTQGSASRREAGSSSDTLPAPAGAQLSQPASRREPPDIPAEYGGVIGEIESWASEGTVIVNAGRLYRLINRIAATRAEAAALSEMAASETHRLGSNGLRTTIEGLALATEALQSDVLGLASLPLSTLTGNLPQLVKYLSKKLGKNVELEISGDTGAVVDRHVLETISEPIRQLIVNAIYHGLEIPTRRKSERKPSIGTLTLDVALKGNTLELVVADDGEGVDWEEVHRVGVELAMIDGSAPADEESLLPVLFEAGFTTGAIDGGRGDGLARLAEAVGELHGRVHFETWPGSGTRVTVRVPAWQALQKVLIVWAGGMRWAIPEAAVDTTIAAADAGIEAFGGVGEIEWAGGMVPLNSFAEAAGLTGDEDEPLVIVMSHRVGSAAFTVSTIEGGRDVAVAELAPVAAGPDHVTGVALLGAGEVALVVDAGRMIERTRVVPGDRRARARVLVVDDSEGGRAVLSGSLASSGFSTSVAGSVAEALEIMRELPIDAVVVDFSLPSASGIALVEEVRRSDDETPIVMLSGVASEEDQARARAAGVDRFFHKSDFREGVLVAALWDLLEG
jgi:chemotaxis protein histidine kinase CheA